MPSLGRLIRSRPQWRHAFVWDSCHPQGRSAAEQARSALIGIPARRQTGNMGYTIAHLALLEAGFGAPHTEVDVHKREQQPAIVEFADANRLARERRREVEVRARDS